MKKSLMLVGAMMVSSFMFAQNDSEQERHRGGDRESMKTVLSLNDAQESSIKEINKKYHEKGREMGKDLQKQREDEIAKVLTPEQNKKWTDYRKECAAKFTKMREDGFKKKLSLTDDQLTKLKSTLSEEQYKKLIYGGGHRRHHGK